MSKKTEFPLVRRRHGVTVAIFRQKRGHYQKFRVVYHEGGHRREISRSDQAEALREADAVLDRLTSGTGQVLEMTGEERLAYLRAKQHLQGLNTPIDLAAGEYAQGMKFLGNSGSLLEATRFFMENQRKRLVSKDVEAVLKEFLEAQRRDGSSPRHIEDLESRLTKFARSFACDIASVTAAGIYEFLHGLNLSPRSRNNYRTSISNLFGFARLKDYVPDGYDPLSKVPAAKEPDKPVGIYSPQELRRILIYSPAEFIPYAAIACFAGLRQSEIERLDWADVSADYIRVKPGEHRTKSNRVVAIQPMLAQWLSAFRKPNGKVVPYLNVANVISRVLKDAQVTAHYNGFRHSFGSYFLALTADATKTSFEMGNSPKTIFASYREVVTPETAKEWFSVSPNEIERLKATLPEISREVVALNPSS